MSEDKSIKLFTAAKELNIGTGTIVDFLATKGYKVQKHPMEKLNGDMYSALLKEFAVDKIIKEEAKQISIGKIRKDEPVHFSEKPVEGRRSRDFENEEILIKNTGHHFTPTVVEKAKPAEPQHPKPDEHTEVLPGVKVVGKIDLDNLNAKALPVEKPVKENVKVEVKQEIAAPEPQPEPEPVKDIPKEIVGEVHQPEKIKNEEKPEVKQEVVPLLPAESPHEPQEPEVIRAKAERLTGPNVIGKMQLPVDAPKHNPVASSSNTNNTQDHKRKRKRKDHHGNHPGNTPGQQAANPPGQQQPHGGNRPDFRNRANNHPPAGGGSQGCGNLRDFFKLNAPQ
ncbi:MAG: translation initiation factor IF-2, partial [Candidatus Saccharimonadales bacterium]